MFSLSTPFGHLLGRCVGLDSVNMDLLLGISAGTFVMFGMNSVSTARKNTDNVYLESKPKVNNQVFLCLSVLVGLTISGLLQRSVIAESNSTDLILNVTDLILNVTDSNSTDLILNVTEVLLNVTG